jgi:hypothetical protein
VRLEDRALGVGQAAGQAGGERGEVVVFGRGGDGGSIRLGRSYECAYDLCMPTISTLRAETRTATLAAAPDAVFAVLADGARLPDWAPAFATAARPDAEAEADGRWLIGTGDAQFAIRLQADAAARTVDLLDPRDERRGAFLRVLPNREGAELLFTLFFPDGTEEAAVAAQMATVEEELATVGRLAAAA